MPSVAVPAQWTAAGAAAGAVSSNWLGGVPRRTADGPGRRSHRAQPEPPNRGGAHGTGAALREARRRQTVSVGRSARPRRRQTVRRSVRAAGCGDHRELGSRSLGPRAIRPGGRCRRCRLRGSRLRVRAAVDRGAGRQGLVPRHRGRPPGRRRPPDDSGQRRAHPARRNPGEGRRRQRRRRLRRARVGRDLSRCAARDRAGAGAGTARARAPGRPLSGGHRRRSARSFPGSPTGYPPVFPPSCSNVART